MECPICDSINVQTEYRSYAMNDYGFGVTLLNAEFISCSDCGEVTYTIPKYNIVKKQVRELLCSLKRTLSGAEFAFLRAELGMRGQEYANVSGVSNVTVSRWENDKVDIPKSADRALRNLTLISLGYSYGSLVKLLSNVDNDGNDRLEVDLNKFNDGSSYSYETCFPMSTEHQSGQNWKVHVNNNN